MIEKKQKVFQLKKIGFKRGEIEAFGQQLIMNLGDGIFYFQSMQELLFNILKQISPVNKSLNQDSVSIEKACEKIIKNFGLHREASIGVNTKEGFKKIISKKISCSEKFCKFIININNLPNHYYKLLLFQVNQDLLEISELIKWYEGQPCIQKVINNKEFPKSHEERKIYDFYNRCISERVEIVNFHLFGIKERALVKSKYPPGWLGSGELFDRMFNDRPYHFARPFSIHYFDCRKIDSAGHRISEFNLEEAIQMQQLYLDNKTRFYRLYFKRIPTQQHFQYFKYYLSYLPLSNNRNIIFDELIRLFKARKWISFYALALPQVEGLFSEMCIAISPEKDLSQKSLTHKVNSVRPFYYMSTSYFDYYQYHVPLQRNRFSHTGYDEDFKLKSYDLLGDLAHLLKVFYELNNPLVKIKKIHTRRNYEDFISLDEFVYYFQLLNDIKPQQKKDIQNEIEKFEKEFLSQECSIEYTCYKLMQELPGQIKEFIDYINADFNAGQMNLKFEKLKISDFNELLIDEKTYHILTVSFIIKSEVIEIIENSSKFILYSKKYMPTLRQEIKVDLEKLQTTYSQTIKNIIYINNHLKKLNSSI